MAPLLKLYKEDFYNFSR